VFLGPVAQDLGFGRPCVFHVAARWLVRVSRGSAACVALRLLEQRLVCLVGAHPRRVCFGEVLCTVRL
jgi:hypothetical protein